MAATTTTTYEESHLGGVTHQTTTTEKHSNVGLTGTSTYSEKHSSGPHVTNTMYSEKHSTGPITYSETHTTGPVMTTSFSGHVTTPHNSMVTSHASRSGYSTRANTAFVAQSADSRIISTVTGEPRETGQSHVIAERTGEARFTGETRIVEQFQSGSQLVNQRVVGIEKGIERQVSVTEVEVGEEIIREHTQTVGRGKRGKKVIREEVIEKIIVVPETIQIEEWVEDEYDMEETVVEVAKKYQIEKVVEVPEIEIVEKIIEQVEKIIREKIVEVPKIQTVERIVEVPIIQTIEKIVEVPEIQYRDIPVEKIVEVPEIKTEEVIREVKKATFIDKPIEQKRLIPDGIVHKRRLPVPVEAETIVEFTVPHLRANYVKKKFPVYLPRFIEVPVSRQFIDAGVAAENGKYAARLKNLINAHTAISLCEVEKLASEYKEFETRHQFTQKKMALGNVDNRTKETMFSQFGQAGDLQHYALYKHLPVEVSSLHMGHYQANTGNLSPITYSSATFDIQGSSRQLTTSHHSSAAITSSYTTNNIGHSNSFHQALPTTATNYSATSYSTNYVKPTATTVTRH